MVIEKVNVLCNRLKWKTDEFIAFSSNPYEDDPSANSGNEQEGIFLYLHHCGTEAFAVMTEDKFIVRKGSQVCGREIHHHPKAKGKRTRLINAGILKPEGRDYVFAEDWDAGDPSFAADIIMGGDFGGGKDWRNAKGITLGENQKRKSQSVRNDHSAADGGNAIKESLPHTAVVSL